MCQALQREGEKKAERFDILMAAIEKKINLKEKKTKLEKRKVELATRSGDTKMLTMRMDELDDDALMIVRATRVKMLKRLSTELETTEKEVDAFVIGCL